MHQVISHKLGRAFAAIGTDGSVVTWGHCANGGDSTSVKHELQDVQEIKAGRGQLAHHVLRRCDYRVWDAFVRR